MDKEQIQNVPSWQLQLFLHVGKNCSENLQHNFGIRFGWGGAWSWWPVMRLTRCITFLFHLWKFRTAWENSQSIFCKHRCCMLIEFYSITKNRTLPDWKIMSKFSKYITASLRYCHCETVISSQNWSLSYTRFFQLENKLWPFAIQISCSLAARYNTCAMIASNSSFSKITNGYVNFFARSN